MSMQGLRPDGADSECSRGLFGITKVGRPLEVAFHQEASPVFGDDFSCSAQLAASSPALQPLFCQKTGRECKCLIFLQFLFASFYN
jgi:hypothetical protein